MKKFLFYILKILVLIILIAIVLDKIYSFAFLQSNKRDKIGFVFNSEPQEYDVVILGSSRANNHFVTEMFTQKGLKTFNFGMQGSKMSESDLMLKLLLEKGNKIKNVIIDADVTLKTENISENTFLRFLPFLHESNEIKLQSENLEDFNYLYYVPFYRYLKYDGKIGFREMIFYGLHKKSTEQDYGGYNALSSNNENVKGEVLSFDPKRNRYYEEIKRICKIKNINLIAVMTPMCKNVVANDYFKKVNLLYPEIHNYENLVKEDKYFSSCGHMNDMGAKILTARILKDFFNK